MNKNIKEIQIIFKNQAINNRCNIIFIKVINNNYIILNENNSRNKTKYLDFYLSLKIMKNKITNNKILNNNYINQNLTQVRHKLYTLKIDFIR